MTRTETIAEGVTLYLGDCLDALAAMEPNSIDSCVCDPPYHLTSIVKRFGAEDAAPAKVGKTGAYARASAGFMGKQWDGGDIAFQPETWRAVWRVLKPGGHLVAFSGTRTYHRMVAAIEDAGFEVRDQLAWMYGSGFPKSHDVSKGIDKALKVEGTFGEPKSAAHAGWIDRGRMRADDGHEGYQRPWMADETAVDRNARQYLPGSDAARQWEGWGTALKPAHEPIVLARKPLSESTIAANVLHWGTGALNVDGCRVATDEAITATRNVALGSSSGGVYGAATTPGVYVQKDGGRWPANVLHDGSAEVVGGFPDTAPSMAAARGGSNPNPMDWGNGRSDGAIIKGHTDNGGSAARFFYQVKQDEPCPSIKFASGAELDFALRSEHVVSALSNAVAASTLRLELQLQSYRAPSTTVTASEFAEIETLVIAAIQNLERRSWRGLPLEKLTLSGSHASIVATPKPTGITTITISLLKSNGPAEPVTFNITETNAEAGASASAPRFWYTSKADSNERIGSKHPTVKPVDLMQWLVRLVTPRGGLVLDPFAGTGTTAEAALREGMRAILCEREEEYQSDIRRRMALFLAGPDERVREIIKHKTKDLPIDPGPLFAEVEQ